MVLPTLLKKGNIVSPKNITKHEKDQLDNTIPIDYIMNFISYRIPQRKHFIPKIESNKIGDKVLILKSATGSGKSTTIAPELYLRFFERSHKNIICTQPRVLTAIDLPRTILDITEYSSFQLEKNIGFQTGEFKRLPLEKGVIFSTIGILMNQLIIMTNEQFMKKYAFIIIDEVHDRDIYIDTTLFLLKRFLLENYKIPECPFVILMSATFDPYLFIDYFNCPESNFIEVLGSTYPIETVYPKYDVQDYISYTVDKALELHIKNTGDYDSSIRDILIFIKGMPDGSEIIKKLETFNIEQLDKNQDNFIVPILLTSETYRKGEKEYINIFSKIEQIKIYVKNKKIIPKRRIIVATNVAETGVTIETLKYCIDTGWVLSIEFNPELGCNAILSKNVTKSMALQRKGRVGRKSPGIWFPCYTEKIFNELPEDQPSSILTNDITSVLLSILTREVDLQLIDEPNFDSPKNLENRKNGTLFQIHSISDQKWYKLINEKKLNISALDFLESPSASTLIYSLERLYGLGFIGHDYTITLFGYLGNKFQKISIELIRMILAGYVYGANILDLITIAVCLDSKLLDKDYKNRNPLNLRDEELIFYNNVIFADSFIDKLFLWYEFTKELDTMNTIIIQKTKKISINHMDKWCESNNINYFNMMKIINLRDEIITNMIDIGLNPYYNGLGLKRGTYNLVNILHQNLEDGIEEIKKIKMCILDGFRFNLVVWNDIIKGYELAYKRLPIIVTSSLVKPFEENQKHPQQVIVSDIELSTRRSDSNIYKLMAKKSVSILDGFIDVDMKFLYN